MIKYKNLLPLPTLLVFALTFAGCNDDKPAQEADTAAAVESTPAKSDNSSNKEYISQPLIKNIYTADPSAHLFNGRIYVYPSHDTSTGTKEDDLGSHFDMRDYHILSMDSVGAPV